MLIHMRDYLRHVQRKSFVEYKTVSEEKPTNDLRKLTLLQDTMNKVTDGEDLIYMIEKAN